MEPMKLDVLFAFFAYGGNGGIAMQLPEISMWFSQLCLDLRDDPRIGRWGVQRFGDIPLTMERNRAVATAKAGNFDVIVMIDSDNAPDLYLNKDSNAKPFFQSSFDFLYERKMRNLPTVVAAPYCGPPPHPTAGGMENVYVFYADDLETGNLEAGFTFESYSRQQAAQMSGIQPIAAGPTGCIMYTTDAFDLMPVGERTQDEVLELYKEGKITKARAKRLMNMQSWFFYEFTDSQQTRKASTEDVTNTREIQLAGCAKHNEPVVFCNWDAWAGHYKPKCVGRPNPVHIGEINDLYLEAVENSITSSEEVIDLPSRSIEETNEEDEEQLEFASEINAEVTPRIVGGRKVYSLGHVTPDNHLEALADIVRYVAQQQKDQPLRIVEVGSWVGESAIAMQSALGKAGGVVHCVDTWEGSRTDWTGEISKQLGDDGVYEHFLKNVGDLIDKKIRVHRGDSVDVANSFSYPQEADIVFLDASHDYKSVARDIEAWLPHVAEHGVLCGHDMCNQFPGVERAVKELCDDAGIAPRIVDGTNIWVVFKKELLEGMEHGKRGQTDSSSEG